MKTRAQSKVDDQYENDRDKATKKKNKNDGKWKLTRQSRLERVKSGMNEGTEKDMLVVKQSGKYRGIFGNNNNRK